VKWVAQGLVVDYVVALVVAVERFCMQHGARRLAAARKEPSARVSEVDE
jgi:hypothetical protein